MASKRAAVSLVQASVPSTRTAIPARVQATTQLSLRQYHSRVQPRQLPLLSVFRQYPASCTSQCATAKALVANRGYSTESEAKAKPPHKIWDFDAVQQLTTKPNPAITIIDVREPAELQQTGRIPGALNIPITTAPDSFHISEDEFEDRFGFPRPARDAEVVFYCRAGVRSHAAAKLAEDGGWTKVGEYPGSWLDWDQKGGKVAR